MVFLALGWPSLAAQQGTGAEPETSIHVRFSVAQPPDFRYLAKIDCDLNPWICTNQFVGIVGSAGLLDEQTLKPVAAGDFSKLPEDSYLRGGQTSVWVRLPKPLAWGPPGSTVIRILPKAGTVISPRTTVHLDLADQPSADRIFHASNELANLAPGQGEPKEALVAIRMTSSADPEKIKDIETFGEWAQRRRALVESLKLGSPPHLTKLRVGTWAFLGTQASRAGGGFLTQEGAEPDFRIFEDLGINMLTLGGGMTTGGVTDADFALLAKEHGIIDSVWTTWAAWWPRTKENEYKDGETVEQRWQRVFDDYYRQAAEQGRKTDPFAFSLATHVCLGDEITPPIFADQILQKPPLPPPLLAYFRQSLERQKATPQLLGAKNWDEVLPVTDTDRARLKEAGCPVEYTRRFYHTKRFIDDYTAMYYRIVTDAVKKHFPKASRITVNYAPGPFQFGFLGNNNWMESCMIDIFECARQGAFLGVEGEDWVDGWTDETEIGVGRVCFGADVLRAAGRKHNLPLSCYLTIGGATERKFYAYLMSGIKEIGLYFYGPVCSIGRPFASDKSALATIAKVTRDMKKFEDFLDAGTVRRARAALLVATTSEMMQVKGLYFCPERQNMYLAIKHGYAPVDIVCEQDIIEDDLLNAYSLLYITDPQMRRATQHKIAEWVQAGGRLFAGVGAANWDEYNQPCNALDPVFGVKKREMITQDNWLTPEAATPASGFAYKKMGTLTIESPRIGARIKLPAWGAKLACEPSTAEVIGTYADGKPGALLNKFGRGESLLAGALVGEAYARAHYQTVPESQMPKSSAARLAAVGIRHLATASFNFDGNAPPVELSVPGFYTAVMDAPQATVVFLNGLMPKGENAQVLATLRSEKKVKSIESARRGKLRFTDAGTKLEVEINCPPGESYVDMLALKH